MPQREVIIKGGPNKTAAFVTGKEELLVRLGSEAVGLATESTLQSVLTTLQAFTEYEAKFVVDANNETFLEVRVWNEDTGTWSGTPTYYRPGETTVASPAPVAPITYADSTSTLNNILTELQSITHSEDTPHVSGNNGVMALGVRNDLDAVLTSNDGDYSPIAVTDTGAVKVDAAISFPSNLDVNVFDGAGTNPITSTTVGPDTGLDVNIIGGATLEVNLDAANDTVQVYGSDLANPISTNSNGELQVDVLTVPATYNEDSTHSSGNLGEFILAVRNDTNNNMTSADGDYSPIAVNDRGAVAIQDGGNSITIDAASLPLPTGAATEATQLLVKAVLDVIQTNTLNTANGITTANTSLNDIENELIALNNTAGTLSLEATQLLVKGVLDAIKLDTANLDVALSTRATEATQLLNNAALLNIFAQLDVDLSTRASEATLASLNAKLNSLGQKASAASAPVVLSTEQEVILNAIKTAVENIDSDLGTGGLALETTQQAIETLITSTNALLTTIDTDTSNLDVLLSTRAADASVLATNALLTTIDGVLDAIKVDTGALVVDVAAIELLITTTNSLLTTIDGVLDAIKLDTANLDVTLSTRASEATLSTINGKFVDGNDIGDVTVNNGAGAAAVNIQDGGNSITVDSSELTSIANSVSPLVTVTPNILISSNDPAIALNVAIYSITFFNNGTTTVDISMDSGTTTAGIPAGVSITMEAGGIKNIYESGVFVIGDTTASGASMIVTYNT